MEIRQRIVDATKSTLEPELLVNATDSRVSFGAWSKGRSSSYQVNGCLRRTVGFFVLGRKRLGNVWVCSKHNPSDDLSRFVALRRPEAIPKWLRHHVAPVNWRLNNWKVFGRHVRKVALKTGKRCPRDGRVPFVEK